MNLKQISYQVGRPINGYHDLLFSSVGLYSGIDSVQLISKGEILNSITPVALTTIGGLLGFISLLTRLNIHLGNKKMRDRAQYPLEYVDNIVIEDKKGLTTLLERTRASEKKEWGTFLKSKEVNGLARTYEILDFELGKEMKLIGNGTSNTLRMETHEARDKGFNGNQHYHPDGSLKFFSGFNYSINLQDRSCNLTGWISLLTFNLPNGPEVIGYNRNSVYIPSGSKNRLVKANPKDIMRYLAN